MTWDEGTWNTYANYIASTETSNLFNVTLMNPDPMNLWSNDHTMEIQKVRITWCTKTSSLSVCNFEDLELANGSALGMQERQIRRFTMPNARGEGCSFEWDLENQYFLNGLKDGPWEIRAKVFCSGYDSFATADVRGSVSDDTLNMIADVTNPYPVSHQGTGNVHIVDFSEEVTCPQLSGSIWPTLFRERVIATVMTPVTEQ